MKRICIVVLLVFLSGCSDPTSSAQKKSPDNKKETERIEVIQPESQQSDFPPFYVYNDKGSRENHFVPSGFMPDGECIKFDDRWKDNCYDGRSCIKIEFDVACAAENQNWSGIFWLNPANNWGARKGGFNLTGARKFTFWARGEKGGERVEEFQVGGISGDYPDSDVIMIGPVILTDQWRQYTIDLRGKDLSYISGGFSWSTNVDANPEQCVFYLDSIRYE